MASEKKTPPSSIAKAPQAQPVNSGTTPSAERILRGEDPHGPGDDIPGGGGSTEPANFPAQQHKSSGSDSR